MTTNGRSTFKKSFWLICREHLSFIHYYQPLRPVWQRPEPSQATDVALERCIQGRFLGVVCHCLPPRLEVPTFDTRLLVAKVGTTWPRILPEFPTSTEHSGIFYMPQSTTWDRRLYFPSEGRRAEEKSDGFGRV